MVKFFSAAQIAPRCFLLQFRENYFSPFFTNKTGHFLNLPPLGIGIA